MSQRSRDRGNVGETGWILWNFAAMLMMTATTATCVTLLQLHAKPETDNRQCNNESGVLSTALLSPLNGLK
jgi:hypothetical protein